MNNDLFKIVQINRYWGLFLDRKGRLNNALFGVVHSDLDEVAHLGSLQNISSVGLDRIDTDLQLISNFLVV